MNHSPANLPQQPPPPGGRRPEPCGFLVLDKPAGLTSHACVGRVRRAYGLRRVGHGGTLDPAVTGVLPIAIGAATRLLPYLPGDKGYVGVVQLGLTTSSDDLEGEELERRAVPALAPEQLELALAALRGPILQRPPRVSAVHVQGQRAYALARRGEDFELAERPVTIHRLELLGWDGERGRLELAVDCSSGTYVRALARDLGERLGCGGCLAGLRRTTALGFGLDGAVPLERLESGPPPPLLDPLPALAALPRQQLNAEQLLGWRCGRGLAAAAGLAAGGPVAVLDPAGQLAGIGLAGPAGEAGGEAWLRPKLVLQASG